MLWYRNREKGWSDMEWMIRDWVNWKWLSGDHIVEQHVHNIDVFNWFSGYKPKRATAFGSRQRRVTGDQYDNFSVDFEYDNGVHMHSMCRQIDGCDSNVSEFIQGTKGSWSSTDFAIRDLSMSTGSPASATIPRSYRPKRPPHRICAPLWAGNRLTPASRSLGTK